MTLRRINLEGIPTALTGTILCSSNGYPRPCAMLWLSLNKHKYSEKHERNHLRAISLLYEHNHILRGKDNLDSLLFNWNFDQIEELLTSYLGKVQNKSAQTGIDYSES